MASESNRLELAKKGVDEVMGIMLDSINKNQEQSENEKELMNRANNLQQDMNPIFGTPRVRVTKQNRWKTRNMKTVLISIVVGITVLIFIVVVAAVVRRSRSSGSEGVTLGQPLALTTTAPTRY
ncbi:vesicle-associated membrane protein 5-like [Arapaima gigas]